MARFILVRKPIVFGVLTILLAAGVAAGAYGIGAPTQWEKEESVTEVNYLISRFSQLPAAESDKDDFFVDFRIDREAKRSRQVELLREIAAAPITDKSTRRRAQENIMRLMQKAEKEARMERLLRARGFQDAVVALEEQGVTVIVAGRVSPEVDRTVADIVYHSLGVAPERVLILGREKR